MNTLLRAQDVSKRFGGYEALSDISFDIRVRRPRAGRLKQHHPRYAGRTLRADLQHSRPLQEGYLDGTQSNVGTVMTEGLAERRRGQIETDRRRAFISSLGARPTLDT